MGKPVRLGELAATDLEEAGDHYRRTAGEKVALEFIDAVERGIKRISRSPGMGSLHFAYELAIPDLRAWPLQRFPSVVFYVVANAEIEVWRVLHIRRDLPTMLEAPET